MSLVSQSIPQARGGERRPARRFGPVRTSPSLALTPAVVAHRGASGIRPEHTLEAYRLAIRMGADDIELDLVSTADRVLVARHDLDLADTTDVASLPEFAGRRTTKVINGRKETGWFVEDFTFAELKRLTARERFRKIRRANTDYHGSLGIPSLNEVLAMVRAESTRAGRTVGVMLELKAPSYFASRGLSMVPPLLADLRRHEVDHPRSRVTVMGFEPTALREVAAHTNVHVVQLLDRRGGPDDLPGTTYAEMITPDGLARIQQYAAGLGVHKEMVLPVASFPQPTPLVVDAHRLWLTVHVWTLRRENRFLPESLQLGERPGGHGNLAAEARAYLAAGVDGLITDHPELVLPVRNAFIC